LAAGESDRSQSLLKSKLDEARDDLEHPFSPRVPASTCEHVHGHHRCGRAPSL
jgi:hypothetical protein